MEKERALLDCLFASTPKKEPFLFLGIGKGGGERQQQQQRKERFLRIYRTCRDLDVPVSSAMSLRVETALLRNRRNPKMRTLHEERRLAEASRLFEAALEGYLLQVVGPPLRFWTERDVAKHNRKHNQGRGVTPDILFKQSVMCRRYLRRSDDSSGGTQEDGGSGCGSGGSSVLLSEQTIHWIDAKMFYGASTIDQGSPCAVGKLAARAEAYVDAFGPGALCLMSGCGADLARRLAGVGVVALDCSGGRTVRLDRVRDQLKTWTGSEMGHPLM